MFAVRDNSKGGDTPYTLVVYFNNKVWNLMIRRRQDQNFALGTPKADEMVSAYKILYASLLYNFN